MDKENRRFFNHCNSRFGTKVTEKYFYDVFDVYSTKEIFENRIGIQFSEAKENGVADIIDGMYVFFNETAYDWNLDTAIPFD